MDGARGHCRPGDDNARDPLEALAEEYFAARRRGAVPTPDEFCIRAAERSGELRRILEAAARLEDAADLLLPRPIETPRQLGRYRIVRTIGRGGMGIVCEAIDEDLGRHVALKILDPDRARDPIDVERFQREARAAARLNHPHIVQVFGAESRDGRLFYVMQLIQGTSLGELLREGDAPGPRPGWLDPMNVARIGLDVAQALAYAHGEGILHRDIKPSNLLLDSSGCIWIADFGLAKTSEGDPITRTGDVVGTPRYLAPETLSGSADHRADVYGLGVTLFELLARRPAFPSDDPRTLVHDVLFAQPPDLRQLDPAIPRDLETIVHKCMEKEATDRFQGARDLAADLRRFLAGEPIVARRPTWSHRAWLFARRHRAAVTIAVAAGLLLVALLVAWGLTLSAGNERERLRSDDLVRAIAAKDAALLDAFRQRGRAEANLATATAAIDRFLARLGDDDVALDPKYQALRTSYLEDALKFLTEMLARGEDGSGVEGQLALTLRRLAEVERMLGRAAEASVHAERAVVLLCGTPTQPAPALPVAEVVHGLWLAGGVAQDRGDYATAELHLRDALAVPRPGSADVATSEMLLTVREQLAYLRQQGGNAKDALADHSEVLRTGEELMAAGHAGLVVRRSLRGAQHGIGGIAWLQGRLEDARSHLEASIRIGVGIGGRDPGDRWKLNVARFDLGGVLIDLDEAAVGRAEQEQALADQTELVRDNPAIPQFRVTLARMHTFLGNRLHDAFDREGARRHLACALELHAELAGELPFGFDRLQNRIEVAISLGAIEFEDDRPAKARSDFADALRWSEERAELLERYPALTALWLLASSNLAFVESEPRAAIDTALSAIRAADRRRDDPVARAIDRSSLDRALVALAFAYRTERRFDDLESTAQRLLREEPPIGGSPPIRATAEALLGDVAVARHDDEEADAHCQRAIELREQWTRAQPRDAENLRQLGDDCVTLAESARARGDASGARAWAERAVAHVRESLRIDAGFRRAPIQLASHLILAARLAVEREDLIAAAASAEEANRLAPADAETQFGCARVFAACSASTSEHATPPTPDADRARLWADEAIERLGAAVRAGFLDAARCEDADEFDSLTGRADYAALLATIRGAAH